MTTSRTAAYFFPMTTDPPLVHLTTADLGNLADGKYDLARLKDLLDQLRAVVLVTPEHLLEWVPLATDSRDRRFALADSLRMALIDWRSEDIWRPADRQRTLTLASQNELRSHFFDDLGAPYPWLTNKREIERRLGEAEFFSRTGHLSRGRERAGFEPFDQSRAQKFQALNGKHGSNILPAWHVARIGAASLERAAPFIGRLVPGAVKAHVRQRAERLQVLLDRLRPHMEASFHGVGHDNPGFQLWWETRRRIWAKPDEVGGLAERIDLHELRLWPMCALMTLDKRVHNAVLEALRALKLADQPGIVSRFVRAGSEGRIVSALADLLQAQPMPMSTTQPREGA